MDFVNLCLENGAFKAALILTDSLTFSEEFRELCEQNRCGRYGKNYTCPPHVGEISELIDKIHGYRNAVIWQTVHSLEDSYDFEGMMDGQKKHNKITEIVRDNAVLALGSDIIVLGAGGCFICESCAANENNPCRFPLRRISSLEAYGLDVSKIERVCELKYINGINTVTYFSGLFY